MLGQLLYEKRFGPYFVEPVVAGLDADGTPFVTAMDLIGAPVLTVRTRLPYARKEFYARASRDPAFAGERTAELDA